MTVLLDRQETAAHPDWWQACFRAARQRGFSAERSAELADRAQRYADADLRERIGSAASETATEPSEDQKKAGNYAKGKVTIQGLPITIENPKGSTRSGKSKDGKEWSITMAHHYGYIRLTESEADGDHVDVFVGPDPESEVVFIVDQYKANGHFDEHKCMIGFTNEKEAKQGYMDCYSADWTGFGDIRALMMPTFKEWIRRNNTARPIIRQHLRFEEDAAGHEHLPAGSPEGGEFTGKPEDGQAPNDMAVSLPTEEQPTVVTPTSQSVESAAFPSPDRMAQTLKLLDENMGLVKNAVRWAQGKYKGRDEHDLISNANMALWKAAQSWDESKGPFENYANVAIANAFKRGKNVQEHTSLSGKEGENIDVEAPREQEPTGPGVAEMHAEIAKLPTREREIMTKVAQGMKGEAIANALSIPHATVRTIIARTKPLLAAALQPREQYQAAHEILRYAEDASGHEHVGAGVPEGGQFTGGVGQSPNDMAAAFAQPQQDPMVTYKAIEDAGLDVAQSRARFDAEIAILPTAVLKQLALAKGYQVRTGEEAKKYLRQALEGFAVAAERNRGISRMESEERPERGPWKKRSPRHAVVSAVNRLQSLEDHAAEYDADEIADVIGEIAEHFDADTFKDIVRRFGLTKGQTKADLVRLLTERIGKTETANGEHL